jgi:hypothetical protein
VAAVILSPRFWNAWLTVVKRFAGVVDGGAVGTWVDAGCQRSRTATLGAAAGGLLAATLAAGEPPKTNVATFVTALATRWTVRWTVLCKAAKPVATRAWKDEVGVGVVARGLGLRGGTLAGWTQLDLGAEPPSLFRRTQAGVD